MHKHIETERLIIRPISLEDNQFIYKLVNSEGWLKYIGDRQVLNLEDAIYYIQKILSNSNFNYSILVHKKTNEPIGVISFLKRDNEEFPDFGFAVLPDYQRKGFAYEASKNYLDTIKTNDSEIIAITLPDNVASIKLLHRLGFKWKANKNKNNELLSYFTL